MASDVSANDLINTMKTMEANGEVELANQPKEEVHIADSIKNFLGELHWNASENWDPQFHRKK